LDLLELVLVAGSVIQVIFFWRVWPSRYGHSFFTCGRKYLKLPTFVFLSEC